MLMLELANWFSKLEAITKSDDGKLFNTSFNILTSHLKGVFSP